MIKDKFVDQQGIYLSHNTAFTLTMIGNCLRLMATWSWQSIHEEAQVEAWIFKK